MCHRTRLANSARVTDFSFKDLAFPEPERTRSILSAIINFIKFCEEREIFLKKLREQSSAALEERTTLAQQVLAMKQRIHEIK